MLKLVNNGKNSLKKYRWTALQEGHAERKSNTEEQWLPALITVIVSEHTAVSRALSGFPYHQMGTG